jgi:transcriptional accessory protein Tex/SPT6
MGDEYVKDPNDVVKVGEQITVTIVEVDRKKKQIRLSMKSAAEDLTELDDESEEEVPTAMEVALRQALDAQEEAGQDRRIKDAKKTSKDERTEMEDIFSRTLKSKVKTRSGE